MSAFVPRFSATLFCRLLLKQYASPTIHPRDILLDVFFYSVILLYIVEQCCIGK